MTASLDEAYQLLLQIPRWENWAEPQGASTDSITSFQRRMALVLPDVLFDWLRRCNGACAGPGGIFGLCPDNSFIDIEATLLLYPEWSAKGWIPIAGDGCGNYYLLLPDASVCFFDTQCDPGNAMYVVASDLPHFWVSLFRRELGETGWPFDPSYVLAFDPQISKCTTAPMPWINDKSING